VVGSTVYAATSGGLSISTDGGATFTNRTTADGLAIDFVRGVYTVGGNVYAASNGGLSISTDGGATFTNRTTSDGLGNNIVWGVHVVGGHVYAATDGGLSISTDGGATFTNKTTSDGLGSNFVWGVYVTGSSVYAATWSGGLSISSDCDSSPPPSSEEGAHTPVEPPTLAQTGPELSLLLMGSAAAGLLLVLGVTATVLSRGRTSRS
jgi:hypothetical protein